MPNYDYNCSKCGKYEVFQSIMAKPLNKCQKCDGPVFREISGGAGIVFKGRGWAADGYSTSNIDPIV